MARGTYNSCELTFSFQQNSLGLRTLPFFGKFMKTLRSFLKLFGKTPLRPRKFTQHKRGQTLVEYALIISLIVVVTIAVVLQFSTSLRGLFSTITSQVSRAGTGS
jgi:Flp pilus assembly pilin Flp